MAVSQLITLPLTRDTGQGKVPFEILPEASHYVGFISVDGRISNGTSGS